MGTKGYYQIPWQQSMVLLLDYFPVQESDIKKEIKNLFDHTRNLKNMRLIKVGSWRTIAIQGACASYIPKS